MLNLEYINTNYELTETSLLADLKQIQHIPEITTVVLPHYFIKYARGALGYEKNISCLIDFPMGMSDIKNRAQLSSYAIKNLANYIDIVVPSHYLTNRKYNKIRDDIAQQKEICKNIRYIFEYRSYDHQYLKKMGQILVENSIDTVCVSTGQSLDVLSDSIIAAQFLLSEIPGIKTIINSNFWNTRHFDLLFKAAQNSIIRSSSLFTIKSLIAHYIQNTKK